MQFLDFLGGVAELFVFGAVDHVGILFRTMVRLVGMTDDFELVDFFEFGGFGFGGTRHAGELFVHAEVVLEGDGGEGLVLALDFDAFFGFDGLMETVAPTAAGHEASGELVDDYDFGESSHHVVEVILIAMKNDVGA